MTALMHFVAAVAGLSSAAGGFAALSLAMDRHWEALYGRGNLPGARQRRLLRLAGVGGLLVSLLVCVEIWGAAQGWVAWVGMMTASAMALVLLLGYRARSIVRVGWMAGGVALASVAATVAASLT